MSRKFDSDVVVPKLFDLIEKLKQSSLKCLKKDDVERLMSLTQKQKKCLLALAFIEKQQQQGVSLKTLATRLDMTLSATSVLVESMVQMNLLHRYTCAEDRRAVRIELSSDGQELFRQACNHFKQITNGLWDDLPESDLLVFADVVERLHEKICMHS